MRSSIWSRSSVAIAAIFTELLCAATQPTNGVVRDQEAVVALPVVLEFRVTLQEVPVGGQRPWAGVGEHREHVDDAVLTQQQAPRRNNGRVQLELLGNVVSVVVS